MLLLELLISLVSAETCGEEAPYGGGEAGENAVKEYDDEGETKEEAGEDEMMPSSAAAAAGGAEGGKDDGRLREEKSESEFNDDEDNFAGGRSPCLKLPGMFSFEYGADGSNL